MNVLKRQTELRLNKETDIRIATAVPKAIDSQTTNVLLKHVIRHSELINSCRDIKIVQSDEPTVTVATVDRPRSFDDFVTVRPVKYGIQVAYDDKRHLQHIASHIGRQIARLIDDSVEQRRYYGLTVVLVNEIETCIVTDACNDEKIMQIFFKFCTI